MTENEAKLEALAKKYGGKIVYDEEGGARVRVKTTKFSEEALERIREAIRTRPKVFLYYFKHS